MQSNTEESEFPIVTYGDRAPLFLTSNLLTAAQYKTLEPLIGNYVVLDGAEKLDFVQKVEPSMPFFCTAIHLWK